jgi:hypothetical protein
MEKYSVKKNQKRTINKFWNKALKEFKPFADRGYVVHDEIKLNSILFIGINPSYNKKSSNCDNIFLNLKDDGTTDDGKLYQYFKKFPEFSEYTGEQWGHLDLLMLRETNQSLIKKIYEEDFSFIKGQLDISKKTIINSSPKVIVICNAFACKLFSKHMFKLKFNETVGTYLICNKSLKDTPVFFSSMLSGQRALDLGSLDRLKWHIKKVINVS